MPETSFDQIVIGAGMAGVCCAGELVLQGQRPLLVCETNEVGAMYRVRKLGENNEFFVQMPSRQVAWGGGWWFDLARRLNVSVRMRRELSVAVTIRGSGTRVSLSMPATAKGFVAFLADAFPIPLDDATAQNLERVVYEALALSHEELLEMREVPLAKWLADQGADEFTTIVLLTLSSSGNDMNVEQARQHCSVYGGLACLRLLLCGEGQLPVIYPNTREGLVIPMAEEIERRGGEVWRGRKVERVLTDDGRITGVAFEDGTEAKAPVVAIAAGNGRIKRLFDPLPPEVVAPIAYSDSFALSDFNSAFLLNRPLLQPEDEALGAFDPATMSLYHWIWPVTGAAPWTTEPGKQIVCSHIAYTPEEVDGFGGPDAVYASLLDRSEELVPGFAAAVEERCDFVTSSDGTAWLSPVTIGPKIPQRASSVDGLWFVGEGSDVCRGIWSEAAASAGILGARAICEAK